MKVLDQLPEGTLTDLCFSIYSFATWRHIKNYYCYLVSFVMLIIKDGNSIMPKNAEILVTTQMEESVSVQSDLGGTVVHFDESDRSDCLVCCSTSLR